MVFQGSAKHEGPVAGWHLIGLAREVQKEAELFFPRSKEVKNILPPWTVQQYSARDLYVMWLNQELNNQITCISIFSNGSLREVSKF